QRQAGFDFGLLQIVSKLKLLRDLRKLLEAFPFLHLSAVLLLLRLHGWLI
ncbi:hypothetical protein Gorai_005921, partial [Gossypium raimondii]|nr:hypothetical protein [Gossypium raimondii]